jgi:hypothetical protein
MVFARFKKQHVASEPVPVVVEDVDPLTALLRGAYLPTAEADLGAVSVPAGLRVAADERTLAVLVTPDHPRRADQRGLALGLTHAHGRRLAILVPAAETDLVLATRARAAMLLGAPIDVYTYDGGRALVHPPLSERMLRSGAAEPGNVLRAGEYRVPPRLAAMARPFEAWADGVPDLAPRHLASARTWVCEGQRVLSIRAARGGLRVIAGAADDSNAGTSVNLTLTAAPTDDELGQVVERVAGAVDQRRGERVAGYREHRLRSTLARGARDLGWNDGPLYRQFPGRRPGGASAAVPFLRLDAEGRLHVVETAHGHSELLAVRGLDAWMWATENRDALAHRLQVPFVTGLVLDLVVAVGPGGHDTTAPVVQLPETDHGDMDAAPAARAPEALLVQLAALSPTITWEVLELSEWATAHPALRSTARSHELTQPVHQAWSARDATMVV